MGNEEYNLDFEKNLLHDEVILWMGQTVKKLFVTVQAYAITNQRILKLKKNGKIKSVELKYLKEINVSNVNKNVGSISYYWEKSGVSEKGIHYNTAVTSGIYSIENPKEVFKILDRAIYNLEDGIYEKRGEEINGKDFK